MHPVNMEHLRTGCVCGKQAIDLDLGGVINWCPRTRGDGRPKSGHVCCFSLSLKGAIPPTPRNFERSSPSKLPRPTSSTTRPSSHLQPLLHNTNHHGT